MLPDIRNVSEYMKILAQLTPAQLLLLTTRLQVASTTQV